MPWPAIDPQFTWHYQLTLDPAFEETTEFSGPPLNLYRIGFTPEYVKNNNGLNVY